MAQELIAYLDRRFSEIDQRFSETVDTLRRHTDQRFNESSEQFREIRQEIQELREESRHTRILVEDLRDDVRLLAEVVDNNDEKTERRFDALEEALARESADTRSLLKTSYSELDRRVTRLEAKAS